MRFMIEKRGGDLMKINKEKLKELSDLFHYMGDLFKDLVEEESEGFDVDAIGTVVEEPKMALEVKPKFTLEEVRAVLGQKAQEGFTDKIRALLGSFGAKKISEVNPSNYEELIAQAEELTNG